MKELLNETMTRAAHELDMARLERANRRLWITLIMVILLLVGTNGFWIYYESSFEDTVTNTTIDATQDGDGNNTVVGGDYESESESNKDN